MEIKKIFFLFAIILLSRNGKACSTVCSGDWNDPDTWSCGITPSCGDTVHIYHTVSITATEDYTGCSPMQIIIEPCGNLYFVGGRKLKLPCGSGIEVAGASATCPAGLITADGYNGNSESLQVCGVVAWQAADSMVVGWWVYGSVLPIELLDFRATISKKDVLLNWSTASETNNQFFTVERSKNGINWESIFNIPGAGTTSFTSNYSQLDPDPYKGISYYRLKQTDTDGRFTYSSIETINFNGEPGLVVFPNPSDGNGFSIEFIGIDEEDFTIELRDIQGRNCYTGTALVLNEQPIFSPGPSLKLGSGNYFLNVTSKVHTWTEKIIIR